MCILTEEQFEEKYNLYSQELMNISYGYTKNRDDSLDVIQNVFYKFFNNKIVFPSLVDEKRWLIRVTINECKDLLRKKKKITFIDEETINTIQKEEYDKNERSKLLEKIDNLPSKYKVVIILFYYDLQSIKDIAIILKLSETAVKKRLERARNMLKKEMEDNDVRKN